MSNIVSKQASPVTDYVRNHVNLSLTPLKWRFNVITGQKEHQYTTQLFESQAAAENIYEKLKKSKKLFPVTLSIFASRACPGKYRVICDVSPDSVNKIIDWFKRKNPKEEQKECDPSFLSTTDLCEKELFRL